MQGHHPWVGALHPEADLQASQAVISGAVEAFLHDEEGDFSTVASYAPREDAEGLTPLYNRPRRALLWVGSAKAPGTSTSESLGQHLLGLLPAEGWETRTVHVGHAVRLGRDGAPELAEAIEWADLVVLSTPVYVDTLPALVLAGLEHMVRAGQRAESPKALLPIVQCGFPELTHTGLALDVLALAAREAGMSWVGHLALAGGGMIDGKPLADLGGRVHHQTAALAAVAEALDAGEGILPETTEAFAKVPIGPRLYRLMGQAGWLAAAWRNDAVRRMWDQPLLDKE